MDSPVNAYHHINEQLAEDAAFLWLLRSLAVDRPHYTNADVIDLERRIDSLLNALSASPEDAWQVCETALEREQPEEVFMAGVFALRGLHVGQIQRVVEVAMASRHCFGGLVSALAWLPASIAHPWLKKFFTSKDLNHKHLAVAVCSARREDPGEFLTAIFKRVDCLAHPQLYSRALRLVGELKRADLAATLPIALQSAKPEIQFWAIWSAVLLGDKGAAKRLQPFALNDNPQQLKAIELVFRIIPVEEARQWITQLAQLPRNTRLVIKASAILGDPYAINWLIAQMRVPVLARLAGEAFTFITGIELDQHDLSLANLPDLDDQLPNDDPAETYVDLNEDEGLPFPDCDRIAAIWQKYQHRFVAGQRYFMGRPPEAEHLQHIFSQGRQRQRRAAALELALLRPESMLLNCAATSSYQHLQHL
ncbi:MAG TPA: TIGR02270 family protein [Cellvibrio sp.]|nr:TIGR02270 family protein [Cellvibrio sp.]